MIMFYSGFSGAATLHQLKTALDTIFLVGKSSFIENKKVLIFDGDMFEYLIDRDEAAGHLFFTSYFHGNEHDYEMT